MGKTRKEENYCVKFSDCQCKKGFRIESIQQFQQFILFEIFYEVIFGDHISG